MVGPLKYNGQTYIFWTPEIHRERQIQRLIAKICLPGTEAIKVISQREHLNGNFNELLKAECAPA